MKNDNEILDFDDRESSDDLVLKGVSEMELDEYIKSIYGEEKFNSLFG